MRPRYTGPITSNVSQPIRAGLLQHVDNEALFNLVVSLVQGDNRNTDAQSYINEIAQFPTSRLLDGGFWLEDTNQRKNGPRYKPPIRKRKRQSVAGETAPVPLPTREAAQDPPDHGPPSPEAQPPGDLNQTSTDNNKIRYTDPTHSVGRRNGEEVTSLISLHGFPILHQPDTDPASTIGEAQHLTIAHDPVEHMWDDVVLAIREDLRAFWGLWETDIAPRLAVGIPVTYDDSEKWEANNVDIVQLLFKLRFLTHQVKDITDHYTPKTSIEERVLKVIKLVLKNLDYKQEDRLNVRLFVADMIVSAKVPDFVYPRPVD